MNKSIFATLIISSSIHILALDFFSMPSFNIVKENKDIKLVATIQEEQKPEIPKEVQPEEQKEQTQEIKPEDKVKEVRKEKIPLEQKKEIKPKVKNDLIKDNKKAESTSKEIINTHTEGTEKTNELNNKIISQENDFNDDKIKVFTPNEKIEINESLYVKSIEQKIKNYATNFYPQLAKGTSIKLKLIIDKNGIIQVDNLRSNREFEINNQIIELIKRIEPYPKPTIINTEKVIIIRTFIFD